MEEVDDLTQAEMAIKLSDNVRDLVRQHLKEALEDPEFIANVNTYSMAEGVMRNVTASNLNFQMAVKNVILNQMQKY